jgi:hypothetical protein
MRKELVTVSLSDLEDVVYYLYSDEERSYEEVKKDGGFCCKVHIFHPVKRLARLILKRRKELERERRLWAANARRKSK